MIPPTLDGLPLFGSQCLVNGPVNQRAREINATFGTDGLEGQDGGGRGGQTWIVGTLFGASASALATAEAAVRSYQDGQTHTLTDSLGQSWPNCKLIRYQPYGRVGQTPGGILYRRYTATIQHLSL